MKLNSFTLMGSTLSQWICILQRLCARENGKTPYLDFCRSSFVWLLERKRYNLFLPTECAQDFNSISTRVTWALSSSFCVQCAELQKSLQSCTHSTGPLIAPGSFSLLLSTSQHLLTEPFISLDRFCVHVSVKNIIVFNWDLNNWPTQSYALLWKW